jgi:hypothetical protein
MQAFVFIKPHAVTEATQKAVKAKFASVGISAYADGELDAAAIEAGKKIDNHYYAIAHKARAAPLTRAPRSLWPPPRRPSWPAVSSTGCSGWPAGGWPECGSWVHGPGVDRR